VKSAPASLSTKWGHLCAHVLRCSVRTIVGIYAIISVYAFQPPPAETCEDKVYLLFTMIATPSCTMPPTWQGPKKCLWFENIID
jgi:hypothetical protein